MDLVSNNADIQEERIMSGNGGTPAIGIDLGTRYSCVGVWHQYEVDIVMNYLGDRTTPSFVSFTPTGRLIGEGAMNELTRNPANTIYDVQRLVGRRFDDPEVQEAINSWPFKCVKGTDGLLKVVVKEEGNYIQYSPDEISSMILVNLKDLVELCLGTTVKDVVIAVPAYFNNSQRQATKNAAHLAGLHVLEMVDEPVSAVIAYGLHLTANEKNVLVFDLDDDTFDVSLVTITKKGELTVKAIGGDSHFGGQDIVRRMVDYFAMEFNGKHNMDLHGKLRSLDRLRVASERAIEDLNSVTETTIQIDHLHQGIDFSTEITRNKFEHINRSFFTKCIETVASCLRDANINKNDVDGVVLVGGSSTIPKVQQLLQEFFNGKELYKSIDAKEVVAYGATILATNLRDDVKILAGRGKSLQLLDIVPLSLGVDAYDGVFSVIIPRNTPIPAKKESIDFTTRDNQRSISFNVYQGERSRAKDNNWLGKFEVVVPLAPKGKSKVKVVFCVDANGILNCWVKEFTTGLKKKIIIDNDKEKLSEEEIEKILKDAEEYKMEDREYKKIMHARSVLEEYIYNVKRKMKTIGSTNKTRLLAEEIKKMEIAIEVASSYLDGNTHLADIDEYQKVLNQLEKLCVGVIAQLV